MSRSTIVEAIGWTAPSLKALARGARAFGDWDEDAITMAVEAARNCLKGSTTAPDALCFASTTAPFLDRQNAGLAAAALDMPQQTHVYDAAGSQRAATSALINANQTSRTTLIAAGERRPTKPGNPLHLQSGDAGAAILIGNGEPIAEIVGTNTVYADIVDHYRTQQNETDYVLEERWFREEGLAKLTPTAVESLLKDAGFSIRDINKLVVPVHSASLAGAVAGALGADREILSDTLFNLCGYAGAAHPLLMLTDALENAKTGDLILLTAFGQGCDAILLRKLNKKTGDSVASAVKHHSIEESYLKFLSASGAIDIDRGIRSERDNRTAQTVAYAKSRDTYGFVGGLCKACGTPQFPKSRRCVNPDCGALDQQTEYRFAERSATIKSFTEDWLAFTREPPAIYGNVSFEGGANVFMEMTGFTPGEAEIGAAVEMAFRIKDIDEIRGFHRYFWKAHPRRGGSNG